MSKPDLPLDALAAASMAADGLAAVSQASDGRGFATAESMASVVRTASTSALLKEVDIITASKEIPSMEQLKKLEACLDVNQTAWKAIVGLNAAQDVVDLAHLSKIGIGTPFKMFNVYTYVERSLGHLGDLPSIKGLPDLLKSIISPRQK